MTSFNARTTSVVVTWKEADIQSNNLVTFNSVDNTFSLREAAICEVSGFVNYVPYNDVGAKDAIAALNVTCQYQLPSTSTWNDFSAARTLWAASAGKYGATTTIPPALMSFPAQTKFRMILGNPLDVGQNHGSNAKITKLSGGKYSRGFKITVL